MNYLRFLTFPFFAKVKGEKSQGLLRIDTNLSELSYRYIDLTADQLDQLSE